jgi:hypothetical protein
MNEIPVDLCGDGTLQMAWMAGVAQDRAPAPRERRVQGARDENSVMIGKGVSEQRDVRPQYPRGRHDFLGALHDRDQFDVLLSAEKSDKPLAGQSCRFRYECPNHPCHPPYPPVFTGGDRPAWLVTLT